MEQLRADLQRLLRLERWMFRLVLAGLIFVVTLVIIALRQVNENTEQIKALAIENRKLQAVQVPTLRRRIAERDATIRDLASEKAQAFAWIVHLAAEAPGEERIVICPPSQESCQPTTPQRGAP